MRSSLLESIAHGSWESVSNVTFGFVGGCGPDNGKGKISLGFDDGGGAITHTIGYAGANASTLITMGVNYYQFYGSMFPHELGHALGFDEEMKHPGFPSSSGCDWNDNPSGNDLGTPPDPSSIMASTGYCQNLKTLSYWDRVGAKALYGARTRNRREGSTNGDLMADLLFAQSGTVKVTIAKNRDPLQTPQFAGFDGDNSGTWVPSMAFGTDSTKYLVGDFNGDRLMDLGYLEFGDNSVHVNISTGAGYWGPNSGRWIAPGQLGNANGRYLVGDFNGDGLDDLGFFDLTYNTFTVSISTGISFSGSGSGMWIGPNNWGHANGVHLIGDYNGDGISDLGFFENGNNTFNVNISTGSSFGGAGTGTWASGFGHSGGKFYAAQFDGSGGDDLSFFEPGDNSFHVALQNLGSAGFLPSRRWGSPNTFGGGHPDNYYPADYNGDGMADLGYFDPSDNTFRVGITHCSGPYCANWDFNGPGSGVWIQSNAFANSSGTLYATNPRRR